MGNVGLLSAIAQAAVDYQNGDSKALHTNLIKNLTYYGVSKFGSAILQLGSVGVYCIDYALSEFATEAWSGRENIYTEAYRLYYLPRIGREAYSQRLVFNIRAYGKTGQVISGTKPENHGRNRSLLLAILGG
jgi:hypothetical protein